MSHHSAKFGVYRSCCRIRDVTFSLWRSDQRDMWLTFLFCHIASTDYMIRWTCDLVSDSYSTVCHHFFKRHGFRSGKWRYNVFMFSSYQVRLPKLESLNLIHHFAKFDVRNSFGGGNITFLFCTWPHDQPLTGQNIFSTLRVEMLYFGLFLLYINVHHM